MNINRALLYTVLIFDLSLLGISLILPTGSYTQISDEILFVLLFTSVFLFLPLYIVSMVKLFMLQHSGRICYLILLIISLPTSLYIVLVEKQTFDIVTLISSVIIFTLIFFTGIKKEFK